MYKQIYIISIHIMYAIDTSPVCLFSLYFVYDNFDIYKCIYSQPPEVTYKQLILLNLCL